MASLQYSTPYSALSYPTYTPLSVAPVKENGTPVDAELALLRAAVKTDVAHQHTTSPLTLHRADTPSAAAKSWAGRPVPDVGAVSRMHPSELLSATPHLTRVNAPLYAPLGVLKVTPEMHDDVFSSASSAQRYYNDIDSIRDQPTVPLTHQPPFHSWTRGLAVVDGAEVEVHSDVVSVSQAAPNLCAFQQECHSLLELLNASSCPRRGAPSPSSVAAPSQRPPPSVTYDDAAGAVAPAAQQERTPVSIQFAHALTPTLPSAEELPLSPSSVSNREGTGSAVAAPAHSITYGQLMREMDELSTLLKEEQRCFPGQHRVASQQRGVDGATSTRRVTSDCAAQITPLQSVKVASSPTGTPEKQLRQAIATHGRERSQRPSLSRLSPSGAALVHASAGTFYVAHLLKWVIYLVERRQNVLQRIQAFEDARAPGRRGACTGAAAGESAANTPPSAIRAAEMLLQLLRSLGTETGGANAGDATEERQMCTCIANLLAEMTAAEEKMTADLLNDAAAGATLEREITVNELASNTAVTPPVSSALSEAYRQDMMDTLTLLAQISQENKTLKLRMEEVQGQATRLSYEVERERAANRELGKHFDQLAADHSRITAERSEMEAKVRKAETVTQSISQEDLLRNQLDRQTLHLRELRAELDDVKDKSDTLRKTILQLRDALVRHRAVIDLLTRRRRERERADAALERQSGSRRDLSPRLHSPSTQLIDDILSGACNVPSSLASSTPSPVKHSCNNDIGEPSGVLLSPQ